MGGSLTGYAVQVQVFISKSQLVLFAKVFWEV